MRVTGANFANFQLEQPSENHVFLEEHAESKMAVRSPPEGCAEGDKTDAMRFTRVTAPSLRAGSPSRAPA